MTLMERLKSENFGLTNPLAAGGLAGPPPAVHEPSTPGMANAPNSVDNSTHPISGNYGPCQFPCGIDNIEGCIQATICMIEHVLIWLMYNILIVVAILFALWLLFGTNE